VEHLDRDGLDLPAQQVQKDGQVQQVLQVQPVLLVHKDGLDLQVKEYISRALLQYLVIQVVLVIYHLGSLAMLDLRKMTVYM
jgi:hypothetical protein